MYHIHIHVIMNFFHDKKIFPEKFGAKFGGPNLQTPGIFFDNNGQPKKYQQKLQKLKI